MRTHDQIAATVRKIVIEHLHCDGDLVTPGKRLEDLGADSLDKIELIMACEEEFGITITDETADGMSTVADFSMVVNTCMRGAA